jgi:hypothetical protein
MISSWVGPKQNSRLWRSVPAPRLLPQLGRLHRRHQDLLGTGAVHLLAHDRLHLAQHPQPHRQPGIEAGGELADHAGTQHQLVADHLGIGRGLFYGGDKVLAGTHGSASSGLLTKGGSLRQIGVPINRLGYRHGVHRARGAIRRSCRPSPRGGAPGWRIRCRCAPWGWRAPH